MNGAEKSEREWLLSNSRSTKAGAWMQGAIGQKPAKGELPHGYVVEAWISSSGDLVGAQEKITLERG